MGSRFGPRSAPPLLKNRPQAGPHRGKANFFAMQLYALIPMGLCVAGLAYLFGKDGSWFRLGVLLSTFFSGLSLVALVSAALHPHSSRVQGEVGVALLSLMVSLIGWFGLLYSLKVEPDEQASCPGLNPSR